MADQHQRPNGGWTPDLLHHLMERLLRDLEARLNQRFEDTDRFITAQFNGSKEAVTTAFLAQKEAVNAALAAAERAVGKAEMATEKRLEGMNEFRNTLSDQAALLMPRKEAEERIASLVERVQRIETLQARQTGGKEQALSGNQAAMWATGILVAIVLGIAAIVASFFGRH
jgi:hypothetical protein